MLIRKYFLDIFYCVFLQILIVKAGDQSSLQLLQILYRHGDRTPIRMFDTDPNKNYTWPEGLGRLTNLGKQQQYELGQYLRKYYKGFLTDNPREISIRSSAKERCLESAECNLAALYKPQGYWKWNNNLNWQPMPIETVPLAEDGMLFPESECPESDKEVLRILKSPMAQRFNNDHQKLYRSLSEHSGEKIETWRDVGSVYDTLKIEKLHNLTVPDWVDPMWEQLVNISNWNFHLGFDSEVILRLRTGLLLKDMISNIQKKINGRLPKLTVFMYSSHDTQVSLLLHALGVFNMLAPPYCATIILELHRNGQHNHTIKVLYLNDTSTEPYLLTLPECPQPECPVGHFIHLTSNLIPQDWEKECGLTVEEVVSKNAMAVIGLGLAASVLLIVCGVLMWQQCRQRDTNNHYQC
ncbi:prostatic acid phosphatase-like isoform X2 [Tachypleus tridentatus]|uniref:prostatic acid phosphatase-like isoform X2 n=1 Tax=Tachypleus tridentatus TaxID=6853 RepID=UPI003FD121B2